MIHVAVAVIEDEAGRILLSRRPEHVHQGGLWEFPGGKLELGESLTTALVRELEEELGITVNSHRPLIVINHDYGDKHVSLDVHRVTDWQGVPEGREGQPLEWVDKYRLNDYPMPAADKPIINAIQLPDKYLITGQVEDLSDFSNRLDKVLAEGIKLVQLRMLPDTPDLQQMLELVEERCVAFDAKLLLNSGLASVLKCSESTGIHLTSADLWKESRPESKGWLGCSCHNSEELRRAEEIGADFALLSPVLPTTSHPDMAPLGWEAFSQLIKNAAMPVYALGGVGSLSTEQAWQHGGQGVAGIRGLW